MSTLVASVRLFESGQPFMSSSVFDATCEFALFGASVHSCSRRHLSGDWGDCCSDDASLNDAAVQDGNRIFSVYTIPDGLYTLESMIWIITESSREYTTVIFPSEY